jgi:hypothetical protein
MEVKLTKEEVVEAIKEYVSNKLSHVVASVDDKFISSVTVELGEPVIKWAGNDTRSYTLSPFQLDMSNTDITPCNLSDIAPDTFGENG